MSNFRESITGKKIQEYGIGVEVRILLIAYLIFSFVKLS